MSRKLQSTAALLAGLFIAGNASAARVGKSEFAAFLDLATGVASHSIGYANGGVPIPTQPVPGDSGPRVGNMTLTPDATTGWPNAKGQAGVPTPVENKRLPVNVTQRLNKAATAKAIVDVLRVGGPIVAGGGVALLLAYLGAKAVYDPVTRQNKFQNDGDSNARRRCAGIDVSIYGNFTACGQLGTPTPAPYYLTLYTNPNTGILYCAAEDTCQSPSGGLVVGSRNLLLEADAGLPPGDLTEQSLADRIASESGWPSTHGQTVAQLAAQALDLGMELETEGVPELQPTQPNVQGTPKTKTSTDGTTETEQYSCDWIVPFGQGLIEFQCGTTTTTTTPSQTTIKTITTTNPDGTTSTTTVGETTPGRSNTITRSGIQPTGEGNQQPCGLPGSHACRLDETGTPTKTDDDAKKTVEDKTKDTTEFAKDPKIKLPTLPTFNWSFQLPSACTDIALPAFAPYLSSIDVCQWKPMFHELMTIVWTLGGIFGAIAIFWRNAFAGA